MSPHVVEESLEESGPWDAPALRRPSLLKMKYIRHRKFGFVLFEGSVAHDEVALRLGPRDDIVSAGFVFTPGTELRCLGHSGTLNIASDPSDAADLQRRITAF